MIELDVSVRGLSSAIKRMSKRVSKMRRLQTELPKALAEYGAANAQIRFDNAAYDIMLLIPGTYTPYAGYHPSIEVEAVPMDDGYAVVANGKEVCFVEFGAGVYFNGDGGTYLGTRPPGVVGIGEYGKGHGKRKAWAMPDGELTLGTPASNALYFTAQDMKEKIEEEVRRILND